VKKQRSKEASKQRSVEKQKSKKQRGRKAKKQENRNQKNAQNGKIIIPKKIAIHHRANPALQQAKV